MTRHQRSIAPDPLLLAAAPTLLLLVAGLATGLRRWQWARVCERICGPFLPGDASAAWIEAFRRAMDWHTPLAASAAAAMILGLLAVARRARGRGTN